MFLSLAVANNMSSMFLPIVVIAIALIVLIGFVLVFKKSKKKKEEEGKTLVQKEEPENPFPALSTNDPAFVKDDKSSDLLQDISPEILAVITCAICASMPEGKTVFIRNIMAKTQKRPIWAEAGIQQNSKISSFSF